jgi:hypothetical protein
MMPHSTQAYDPKVRAFSFERAFAILAALR